jgi:hypothetical protein
MDGLDRGDRLATLASLAMAVVLVASGCGATPPSGVASDQPAPASAAASPSSAVVPDPPSSRPASGALVELPAATDPVAGGRMELDLVRQLREEAGVAERLGAGGPEALAALDRIEAEFGQKVLEDAAKLADGGAAVVRSTVDQPALAAGGGIRATLASTGGTSSTARQAPPAIDTSLFASTGFTANALMGLFAGIVRSAATNGRGSIPRQEHFTEDAGGLHQEVDLATTLTVQLGDGHASGDIQMSATDRISTSDGTFVALYTSTADGHFDVNACPDAGGIADGTYSFKTKHELNDLSGGTNVQSGAGRSVQAPIRLVDGDDAKLQRIEATLSVDADARGPGASSGAGAGGPYDWTASQTIGIVMPVGGGTTSSGSGPTVNGTGSAAASGSMFLSSAMAQLFLAAIGGEAEKFWRSGACIKLEPSRDSGTVKPSEKLDLKVESKAAFGDHADVKGPIVATFTGRKSLDPHDEPRDAPATFQFEAGPDEGDVGTIQLEQTSRRGIGKRQVVYTVGGGVLLSLTSKSVFRSGPYITVTYQGTVKELRLSRADKEYEGKGSITVKITYTLSAPGAKCTGSASRNYDLTAKAVPIADHEDQLDLRFEYPVGSVDRFTIECKTKEGSGSMPAPWSGLLNLLPLPGDVHRVTIDSTTHFTVPVSPPITVDVTLRREKK